MGDNRMDFLFSLFSAMIPLLDSRITKVYSNLSQGWLKNAESLF